MKRRTKKKSTVHKATVPANIKKLITAIGRNADALRKHTVKKSK